MLSVPFEHDFQKIAKVNSQEKKKQSLPIAKISSRKTQKLLIRKIELPQKFSATL